MSSSIINLRNAAITDLPLFKKWDEAPHVIESDPNDDWNWEIELRRSPEWREQLIAEIDGRSIGFIQIIDPDKEESHYWGSIDTGYKALDIWIGNENDLGKGYGTEMMTLAIDRCFRDKNVRAIVIDPLSSNIKAHRFYERLGFKFMREQTFGEDNCFVYELTRQEWRSHTS